MDYLSIKEKLPKHIGIIMDGNGRWAQQQQLPREMGHVKGSEVLVDIARYCNKIGIQYLTVYAFSTENWKRSTKEIDSIMGLFQKYLDNTGKFKDDNIRFNVIGDISKLSAPLRLSIKKAINDSKYATGLTVNIAINYGGRSEIVNAFQSILEKFPSLSPSKITEELISDNLYTSGQPDPDLIIRPSGELRLSNFMTWQSAYSEFVFMNILWPDFTEKDLDNAIDQYLNRERRFGGTK